MDEFKQILAEIEKQKALIETSAKSSSEKMEALDTLYKAFDTRLKELETSILTPRKAEVSGLKEEKEAFSFLKAVHAIKTGDWTNAGFEAEVFAATQKAGASSPGSAGGYIVPNVYVAELIELLRAEMIVAALGATMLDGLNGSPVEFPKQTGGATAYWVAENSDITPSDLTFGQLAMQPKAVAAMVKLSNRLLKLSNPSAEAMVRRDIAQALGLAVDYAALNGTGSDGQPLGVANTPSILTEAIGATGGTFTFTHASNMEGKVEDANALRGSLGFAMHGKVKRMMKNIRIANYSGQTDGNYIVSPIISDAKLAEMLGYQLKSTTQIPTNLTKSSGSSLSQVFFGNWQELLVGQWGGLEITASSQTSDAFQKNQTWVRVIQEVDVAVRHPESFCLCSDAATA